VKILILDNYDSFTYNLVHLIEKVSDASVSVYLNDKISLDEANNFDKIVLSPGPGLPKDAGIMPDLLKQYSTSKDIFGVCLGFQAIGEHYGGSLKNLKKVYHGLATSIRVLQSDPLFKNCPESFNVGRYHSWVIDKDCLPKELHVIAEDENGNIMAGRHYKDRVCGVQFHPESILSQYGEVLMHNWLNS
jgi:anthranilate synthase component 2